RVRPAPQGRAYREQRHFCHVTILLSNDAKPDRKAKQKGATGAAAVAAKPVSLPESKGRKRGGAAAAPRAKRTLSKGDAASKVVDESRSEGKAKTATKRAAKKKPSNKE